LEIIKEGYTRVSQILGQWDKYSGIDPAVLDNKIRIGTNVHEAINMFNLCLPYSLKEDERPYMESYLQWYDASPFILIESEKRYYDEEAKITGAIDAVMHFKNDPINDGGQIVLCDWKCSYAEDPLNWPLQGAMYYDLLKKNGVESLARKCRFVKFDKHGGMPKVYEYEITKELLLVAEAAKVTYFYQKKWLDKRKQGERE